MSTTILESRITKIEDRLDRLEQLILQQPINITKSQQETDKPKMTLAESNSHMEQGFADLRKSHRQLNKQLRELSCRLGTIVEDLVAPSLERIFFEVTDLPNGSEILINVRVKRRHTITREIREFDAIVESEKYLLVNETKSKLKPEDIPHS